MKTTDKESLLPPWPALIFILAAGTAVYFHILPGEFISDDYRFIAHNPVITGLRYGDLWSSFNARYLVGLTFMVNYDLHGLAPFGYHLFSLAVHMINAALVFVFCRQSVRLINLGRPETPLSPCKIAWLAMAIFLCHPVQTQAVSFVAQRGTLMVTAWYLLVHILYLKGRRDGNPLWLGMVFVPLLLGFITKEIIITAGVTLILCEILIVRPAVEDKKGAYPWLAGYMTATLLFPLIFFQTKSTATIKFQHLMGIDMFEWKVFLTQFNVLVTYLRLFIAPVGLRADYFYPVTHSVLDTRFLLAVAILGVLVWAMIVNWRRRPLISFCLAWFFVTKSVEFVGVSFGLRNLIYENWLYLSMAGLCLLAGYLLSVVIRRDVMFSPTAAVLVMVIGIVAHTRNYVWIKEIDHYKDLVAKEPRFPSAYLGLSDAYLRKGMRAEGVAALEEAVRLKPDFGRALNNLARFRWEAGRPEEAMDLVDRALAADPNLAPAYYNKGFMAFELGDAEDAVEAYEYYLKLRPDDLTAHYYVAQAYWDLKQKDKVREHLLKTRELALDQNLPEWVAAAEGDLEEL